MTKKLIILPILFLSLAQLSGQDYGVEEETKEIVMEKDSFIIPQMVLKWSFSSLANIHPALQFGFEHHLKNRKHALYHEIGTFIPYNGQFNSLEPVFGLRLRTEYRHYLRKPRRARNNFLGFVYMPQLKFNGNDAEIAMEGGEYFQRFEFRENYLTNKFLFTYGANRVGREGRRVFFEWAVSAGIQTRTVFITGLPDGVETNFGRESFFPAFFNLESNDLEPEGTKLHGYVSFSLRIGRVMK